jgi:hypothetical protein
MWKDWIANQRYIWSHSSGACFAVFIVHLVSDGTFNLLGSGVK